MFITRCDRCGAERGENIAGWSKLSIYARSTRPDKHLDLCPGCTDRVKAVLTTANT